MSEPTQPQRPGATPPPYGAPPPPAQNWGDQAGALPSGAPGYGVPPGYAPPGGPPPGYPPPAYSPPGYGPPSAYGPPSGFGQAPRTEDTIWGILAHLSIFVFALIAPLVIYLVFKDTSAFARHHAAEALNFHITLLIATLGSIPLVFVLIGIPLLLAIVIASCVFAILATIAASRREPYRYPLTIRFVS